MFYDFPEDLTLDEVRSVVREHNLALGVDAIVEADRGDHIIFNYIISFNGLFPQPDTSCVATNRKYAILRECRGLIFEPISGEILSRRFHKFFNVNEKDFTQDHKIDWSQPHVILDKLDGSMITPLFTGGAIRWATKMGLTEQAAQVEQFLLIRPIYTEFAKTLLAAGSTPIFEWTSRQQRIVIDYPEDKLILTAIRRNACGSYLTFNDMKAMGDFYGIPVVKALAEGVTDIKAFIEVTKALIDAEGYVIRFNNGHMVKLKAEEYCRIHATQDALHHEKDVWSLVLNDTIDDVVPFMIPRDAARVDNFVTAFDKAILTKANELNLLVLTINAATDGTKKHFAEVLSKSPHLDHVRSLLFSIQGGRNPVEVLRAHLLKNVSTSTKLEAVRPLLGGIAWRNFYGNIPNE